MVDIVHEYGKEAMMFMGDHWIGMEPFMDEFAQIGLDAVVGSVGNGATLRLFSDIKHVKYTEGRFLPYFFPDTFHEGGDPVKEAKVNWGNCKKSHSEKPDPENRLWRISEACRSVPGFCGLLLKKCVRSSVLFTTISRVSLRTA